MRHLFSPAPRVTGAAVVLERLLLFALLLARPATAAAGAEVALDGGVRFALPDGWHDAAEQSELAIPGATLARTLEGPEGCAAGPLLAVFAANAEMQKMLAPQQRKAFTEGVVKAMQGEPGYEGELLSSESSEDRYGLLADVQARLRFGAVPDLPLRMEVLLLAAPDAAYMVIITGSEACEPTLTAARDTLRSSLTLPFAVRSRRERWASLLMVAVALLLAVLYAAAAWAVFRRRPRPTPTPGTEATAFASTAVGQASARCPVHGEAALGSCRRCGAFVCARCGEGEGEERALCPTCLAGERRIRSAQSPWRTLWLHPRETLRRVLDEGPRWGPVAVLALAVGATPLLLSLTDHADDAFDLTIVFGLVLLGMPILGAVQVLIGTLLVWGIGRLLGGRARPRDTAAALTWSAGPVAVLLPGWFVARLLLALLFFGGVALAPEVWRTASAAGTGLVGAASLWSLALLPPTAAEAHGFGLARGLATVVLAAAAFLLVLFLVAAVA